MLVLAALGTLLVAVIIMLLGVVGSQRGQKAVYYAARREAQRAASRMYAWSLWCAGLALALFVAGRVLPAEVLPTDTARVTATAGAVVVVTDLMPRVAAAKTGVPTPISTETPATAPSTLAADIVLITPLASLTPQPVVAPAVQPMVITVVSAGKPLTFRAVSSGVDSAGAPVNAGTQFSSGVRTIYVVFDFRDIPRNTVLGHAWIRNGTRVSVVTTNFAKPGSGMDSISWTPKGGFTPGLYEVRVALANAPQFTANFLVK